MTFKDKWILKHPNEDFDDKIIKNLGHYFMICPYHLGYEDEKDRPCETIDRYGCENCWNREIPEKEV